MDAVTNQSRPSPSPSNSALDGDSLANRSLSSPKGWTIVRSEASRSGQRTELGDLWASTRFG